MELPIVLPLLALILLWVVLGWLFARLYPWMRLLIHTLRPDLRSIFQLVYSLLPLMIAATTAILVFTPFLGGIYLSSHCHDLICDPHVPVLYAGSVGGKLITIVLFGIVFITAMLVVLTTWKNHRSVSALCRLSRSNIHDSFSVLETADIFACSIGNIKPTVLISRGILDRASPDHLRVIVGHELAHGYRLDNLRRFLASTMTIVWPQQQRNQLLGDMEISSEQCCDRDVSRMTGDQSFVAETVRLVNNWRGITDSSACCVARINALSETEHFQVDGWKPAAMMLTGSIVFTLLTGEILHRAAESLFSVVIY
jgi:hypothetical protein